ncbi:hypothetical protein EDD21DRAFT_370889 [Dissophora ornata]|nr:hypothetical protein EDD21DRAFT_370889 [Dissophora ornata]
MFQRSRKNAGLHFEPPLFAVGKSAFLLYPATAPSISILCIATLHTTDTVSLLSRLPTARRHFFERRLLVLHYKSISAAMPPGVPSTLFHRAQLFAGEGVPTQDPFTFPFTPADRPYSSAEFIIKLLYRKRDDGPRPHQVVVRVADWLSLVGSLLIILHAPRVAQRVPTQRKRMLIIFFIAISNFGFALANVITDYTGASSFVPCSISAWCYVFFQLLTCSLVIVSTFRLCGVFLFTERRSIPSKYIAICPILAFTLATTPAAAGHFNFNECGRYCWFTPSPNQQNCRVRSPWAWLCYYAWMILFLSTIFASTLFVMLKIAIAVMHSRSDLKQVANQTMGCVTVETPPTQTTSTFGRLRTMSQSIQQKTTSLFSAGSRRRGSTGSQREGYQSSLTEAYQGREREVSDVTTASTAAQHDVFMTSFGLSPPTAHGGNGEGSAPSSSTRTQACNALPNVTGGLKMGIESVSVLHAKERPFLLAILRQALYPITISISGFIQVIVDLTLAALTSYGDSLSYAATVATSIQGFLFFLVFLFDPAVVQTRQQWRKYMVWKYYVEFYYSLGMPHEGRDFEDKFMEKCQSLNRAGKESKFDQLTRPPSYSWSLQYDDLAMPLDFQTAYPLTSIASVLDTTTVPPRAHSFPKHGDRGSSSHGLGDVWDSEGGFRPTRLQSTIPEGDETYSTYSIADADHRPPMLSILDQQHSEDTARMDYTYSFPYPSSSETRPRRPDQGDTSIHPLTRIDMEEGGTLNTAHVDVREEEVSDQRLDIDGASNYQPPTSAGSHTGKISVATFPLSSTQSYSHGTNPRGRLSDATVSDFEDIFDNDLELESNIERSSRHPSTLSHSTEHPTDSVLSSKLTRAMTIGGGIANTRRYRLSAPRTSGPLSGGVMIESGSRFHAIGGSATSFKDRLRFLIRGSRGHTDPVQQTYQTLFMFPKVAYLLHMLVRQIYIPREVRLPPIPNPLKERNRNNTLNTSSAYQRATDEEGAASVVQIMADQQRRMNMDEDGG